MTTSKEKYPGEMEDKKFYIMCHNVIKEYHEMKDTIFMLRNELEHQSFKDFITRKIKKILKRK